jgi:hypothetical protein
VIDVNTEASSGAISVYKSNGITVAVKTHETKLIIYFLVLI